MTSSFRVPLVLHSTAKTTAASGAGVQLLEGAGIIRNSNDKGGKGNGSANQAGIVTTGEDNVAKIASAFVKSITQHRHWERELAS